MSALLPDTCRLLSKWTRESPSSKLIREHSAEDRRAFAGIREWLARSPHVAWCRCVACRKPETTSSERHFEVGGGDGLAAPACAEIVSGVESSDSVSGEKQNVVHGPPRDQT